MVVEVFLAPPQLLYATSKIVFCAEVTENDCFAIIIYITSRIFYIHLPLNGNRAVAIVEFRCF